MVERLYGEVEKGWGSELIWESNDLYCGKFLNFNSGSKFSMHFHAKKTETWYVLTGKFKVHFINPKNAEIRTKELNVGDTWTNPPLYPHQLECIEVGTIIEVSTADSVEDNYRVFPGDSQKQ
jgi:mannose-6-phosphate isomerase-like protein (cupin superfamily)